jgi:hypothetical protein
MLYAQVVKSYRRQRLVGVKHRVVFGTMERVQQVLVACGQQINTSFVERLNLDMRQRVAALCAGNGSRIDRPDVVATRGTALSGAAVAPAADGLSNGAG